MKKKDLLQAGDKAIITMEGDPLNENSIYHYGFPKDTKVYIDEISELEDGTRVATCLLAAFPNRNFKDVIPTKCLQKVEAKNFNT